ncbi:MAG: ABC transporter substrate-binding protein [Rhodobacteraceae bacterium]|nr:ABC transporter substrate-binding protein [Paracoccaceae bacterium]
MMLAAQAAFAQPAPQRIVSLYPCLDAILVNVAERDQISALSYYARNPRSSTIAEIAETLPFTYGTSEEVIAREPDLVLSSRYGPAKTHEALERLGVPVALFDVPLSVKESLGQVREMARLVGHPEHGEAVVTGIERALAESAPPPGQSPVSALVFQSNGFVAGEGVLIDELLNRTGFVNRAADYRMGQFGIVSLELIIADPPEALLAGTADTRGYSWADRVVSHPALKQIAGRMARTEFPEKYLLCGGPVIAKTARTLAAARRDIVGGAP